jgi:hypothetical protein
MEGTTTGPQEAMQAGPEDNPKINASPNMKDAVTGAILALSGFRSVRYVGLLAK